MEIDERNNSDPERAQLVAELRAERARLRLALEAAELGDWELDLTTNASPRRSLRHDKIFGYEDPLDEWSFETFIEHVHPDDRDRVSETFRAALEDGHPWDFECRINRVDGEQRWIWARGGTHHDGDGTPIRMLGVVRDITDRKAAEEERERLLAEAKAARAQAEEANRAKGEFLAVMSHELRTPMNAILGYVDLMALGVPDPLPASSRTYVERVGASARHLLDLIDEVLTFSRIQAGRQEIHPEPADLHMIVREAAMLIDPLAREKGLALRTRTGDEPVRAITDPARTRQILLNLLGNAVKFTDEGWIEIRVRVEDEHAVLEVEDTGIGIEPSQLGPIFEPFRQAEHSLARRSGGTGLGLAVTRQLVDLLDGTVDVRSEPGAGSTFTVRLPRVD